MMFISIVLAAVAVWAIAGSIVAASRDGYRRLPSHR